jgi:hypothetical protein
MTTRAKFFRLKAEECAALAKMMVDQFSRAELERTSAHWLRLAEDADLIDRLRRGGENVLAADLSKTDLQRS